MRRLRRFGRLLGWGLLLLPPRFAHADDHDRVFYPHLSTPAATVGNGDVAFQAFPGSNGLQSFFLNALDVGIGPYLEVGTSPFFYLIPVQRYNFNGKLNFLKLHNLHLAVGASMFAFDTTAIAPDGSSVAEASYTLVYYLLAADLFLSDQVAVGFNVARPKLTSDNSSITTLFGGTQTTEWFVDLSLRLGPSLAFTPGFGVLRLDTLNPTSLVPFGYGATVTLVRGKAFLGDISVGLQFIPKVSETKFLFSFSLF